MENITKKELEDYMDKVNLIGKEIIEQINNAFTITFDKYNVDIDNRKDIEELVKGIVIIGFQNQ